MTNENQLRLLTFLGFALIWGCTLRLGEGQLRCDKKECPSGWVCSKGDQRCYSSEDKFPPFDGGQDGSADTDTGTHDTSSDSDTDADSDTDTTGGTDLDASIGCSGENLIVNPSAETGDLTGWTLTENPGAGWRAVKSNDAPDGTFEFATSYDTARRQQSIDLWSLGYRPEDLDKVPDIQISEWFREARNSGGLSGDTYFIRVKLLDADSELLASWSLFSQLPDSNWLHVTHTFFGYGKGLRFIQFFDGGSDAESNPGYSGTRLDNASVVLCNVNPYPTEPDGGAGDAGLDAGL